MRKALLIACLSASCSYGCSLVFVTSPPATADKLPPSEPLECTSSKAAPIIDTVITGYQAFRTGYALSRTDADYKGAPINRDTDIAFGVGLAALFLASSVYGYTVTSECADAKARHERKRHELNAEGTSQNAFTVSPNRPANSDPAPQSFTYSPPTQQSGSQNQEQLQPASSAP